MVAWERVTVMERIAVLAALVLVPAQVRAQGRERDAAVDASVRSPESMVATLRAGRTPIASQSRRSRAEEVEAVRPRLERGRCYEIVGAAQGASQVRVQVRVREAVEGAALALANSQETPVRGRFCVVEAPELYRLDVEATGPAWWHVEVFPSDERVASPETRGPSTPEPPEAVPTSAPRFAVGGTAQDYLAGQLRQMAAHRAGTVGFTDVVRRRLGTNEFIEAQVTLPSERCVEVLGAGVPSVADLVVELEDPAGHRVATDNTHRGSESARYCTRYAGVFRYRVRVFMGSGDVAAQVVIAP